MHYKKNISFILIFLFTFLLQVVTLAQASFQGLGDLPGGSFRSDGRGVSADGLVVVGRSTNADYNEAFLWTASSGMVGLGVLPGGSTQGSLAYATSADGSVVVGISTSVKGSEAFRWTESGGMMGLGFLPGLNFLSEAHDVSADGSVVVGYSIKDPFVSEAFRWTASTGMVGLGDLPGGNIESNAQGVSADGSVVVGYSKSGTNNTWEAFLWTESGGMIGLGDLPGGSGSYAYDVSPDGSIVVGYASGQLFRWTNAGGMEVLGGVGNFGNFAVSADGSVIVGILDANDSVFIYTDVDGIRNLKSVLENDYGIDLTGWILRNAPGISDDGTVIIGDALNPNDDREAWRAVIPPLPPLMVGWNNPDGGDFSDSKNWEGGAVPNENQIAVFDTTVSGLIYEVTFSSNVTNYALQVGENPVSFNLAPSHIYTLTDSDSLPTILIGASTGNIEDSRAVFGNGTVRALGNVDIGVDGNRGELTVPNGGILEIDGPADKILRVGVSSCGTGICGHMEIRSGGIVRSITGSQIGVKTSSEGSVLVTANGSQWIDESICDVGVLGKGTITIEQEGSFNGKTVVLGSESTQAEGSITVTGVGSSFSTSANFSIGLGGIGTFNVTDGA